jgi:hypothetical protein
LEKVVDNTYKLSLPPYMRIYSVVNVENLKLYDPSMLDQEEKGIPSIEDLAPDAREEMEEDVGILRGESNQYENCITTFNHNI